MFFLLLTNHIFNIIPSKVIIYHLRLTNFYKRSTFPNFFPSNRLELYSAHLTAQWGNENRAHSPQLCNNGRSVWAEGEVTGNRRECVFSWQLESVFLRVIRFVRTRTRSHLTVWNHPFDNKQKRQWSLKINERDLLISRFEQRLFCVLLFYGNKSAVSEVGCCVRGHSPENDADNPDQLSTTTGTKTTVWKRAL